MWDRICGPTEMGRAVQRHDWSLSPLGPPDVWSPSLCAAVGICMNSRFPMLIVWGPELIQIYNDGYRVMLGRDKHPAALGERASATWKEVWDVIGPMFDEVRSSGTATWELAQRLDIERNGYLEECYFRYSYSPIYDGDGSIGGVLNVVTETTVEVLAERRLSCLAELGAVLAATREITEIALTAGECLADAAPDITHVSIYLRVADSLALVASNGRDDLAELRPDDLLAALTSKQRRIVGPGTGDLPSRSVVLPLAPTGGAALGVLVLGLNPERVFDQPYAAFAGLVADALGAALDNAARLAHDMGEYKRIADTLQSAMLAPASDLPTVAARYVPAVGNLAVGGDWYDVIELTPSTRALIVGDCVGHGLDAAAAMSQLRSAARSMLYDGRSPAEVLDGLSRYARSVDGAECATVVCAIVDRAALTITYGRAGHLPPLLLSMDGSGTRWLDGAGGPPLAVDSERTYTEEVATLERGDIVLLFSDGLVERRGEVIDEGLERLRALAVRQSGSTVQELAGAIMVDMIPAGPSDDVVLVVKVVA